MAKCVAEMVAREHYNIWIQWKNAFHKSAQVGDAVWPFWILKKKFTPKKWWKEIHSKEMIISVFDEWRRWTMWGRFHVWSFWILKKKSTQKIYFKLKLSYQNKYHKNTNRTEAALYSYKKKIGPQTQNYNCIFGGHFLQKTEKR